MFAMSARVSPCSARLCCASSLRATSSVPSSRLTLTFAWISRVSSPFGPFTRSVRPSIFTSTPCGTLMGRRPMRLIPLLLPDPREDFPAESLALGLAPGHETGRGRDDGDPKAAEHAWHLGLLRVHAQTRAAHALQTRDRGRLPADVFHLQDELARRRLLEG